MGVFIRIAKVPFNLAKMITPTSSERLTTLNELQQPAELRKRHCPNLWWRKGDLNALSKCHPALGRAENRLFYRLFCLSLKNSTSLLISNYFPTKAALEKGGGAMGHLLGMENTYNYAKLVEKRSPFITEPL